MLDILDIIAAIGEIFASWRFYLCLALAAAVIFGLYSYLPDSSWRLALSIAVASVALAVAIVWERRSG
jgi:hypothetical protein